MDLIWGQSATCQGLLWLWFWVRKQKAGHHTVALYQHPPWCLAGDPRGVRNDRWRAYTTRPQGVLVCSGHAGANQHLRAGSTSLLLRAAGCALQGAVHTFLAAPRLQLLAAIANHCAGICLQLVALIRASQPLLPAHAVIWSYQGQAIWWGTPDLIQCFANMFQSSRIWMERRCCGTSRSVMTVVASVWMPAQLWGNLASGFRVQVYGVAEQALQAARAGSLRLQRYV